MNNIVIMTRKIFSILMFGLLSHFCIAQDFDKTKLDNYFNALETNNKFMGSIAVSKNGDIIYSRTIGFSDVQNGIKANENTKYRIGSISKTFTTVLVFKAIEENKLSLDQTVSKFFPTIMNADKITMENLLGHRSGIHNFTNDAAYLTWNTQPKTEKEMVEIIVKGGSDFEPGSKADYSNSNFVLLSFILEKVYKKPYGELLKKYITEPAGLTNTFLGGKVDVKNNECNSYRFTGSWVIVPETDISIPLGAGGIVSTPTDLVKFSNALFGGKLLKEESLAKMEIIKDKYGLGLFPIPFFDKSGYGHTGGIDGFSSVFCHFADGDISYALTSNGTNYNNNNISIAVLSALYNKPYDIPVFTANTLSPEDMDKYIGLYSSAQLPLKITISKKENNLIAQATGQNAFPLEAAGKDTFKFDMAGLVMEFNPSENSMILKQGGAQFKFTREK
jgi:CubicO group peptidase (beta-lactamase class C family)